MYTKNHTLTYLSTLQCQFKTKDFRQKTKDEGQKSLDLCP